MSEAEIQVVANLDPGNGFAELVAYHLAGELSDIQRRQFNAQLATVPERRRQFVAMCIQAHLFAVCVDPEFTTEECLADFFDDEDSLSGQIQTNPSPPVAPTFLPTASYGTVGWFSSGWPVAYLIATVICGVSMVIGSLIPTSQPIQFARRSSVPSRGGS